MLFTVTVVDLVVFLKRIKARSTFAVSKSSFGASFCTLCRVLAFFFLDWKSGVSGVLQLFLRFVLFVGVWRTGVEGLLPASGGGEVDAALAAMAISAVSFGATVAPSVAFLGLLRFPLIACEGEQREHDERCFRLQ